MPDVVADSDGGSIRLAHWENAAHGMPVDKATHARFLTYLETWPYFRPPRAVRLTGPEFAELDAELQQLERDLTLLDADGLARRRALRRLLMLE